MDAKDIARYFAQGTLGGFSTSLMLLFQKADLENQKRLSKAYPEYYEAYLIWMSGEYDD